MKRKSKLLGILLVIIALVIMQLPASEADAAASASDFKLEGSTLVLYQGKDSVVTVPGTVTKIGENAFSENDNITKVILNKSVTQIEPYAFWGCDNLESVVLGTGIQNIGDYAFANCKGLKQMKLPETVRSIGLKAFVDCVNMTEITILPKVTQIHETAFDGCYRLVIRCETGSYADKYAGEFYLRQQEMPEYEDVSDYDEDTSGSVSDNDGADVTPPGYADEGLGSLLGLTKVVGNHAVVFIDNTSQQVINGASITPEVPEEQITEIGQKYTIVDEVVVADQAYYKNNELTEVTLPGTIKEIGQFAYARSSLQKITVPESVQAISYGAFYHCDELEDVELPSGSILCVEPKAFAYTAWVERFMQSSGGSDFLISGDVLVAYKGNKASVVIPDGVRVIAGEAFAGHTEIETVNIPRTLRIVGEAAFEGCSNLTTISITDTAEGITDLKDRAFAGTAIRRITIPATVKRIGMGAFDDKVEVSYAGSLPQSTYEISAQRLSNEAYRLLMDSQEGGSVSVRGLEGASGVLDGASRPYILSVNEGKEWETIARAFARVGQNFLPDDLVLYELSLRDSSNIPITKLGRQLLTVTMPLPEELAKDDIRIVGMDRNGQLEKIACERVKVDGVDSIRFRMDYVSMIGIYGDGKLTDEEIIQISTVITEMSSAPAEAAPEPSGISLLLQYRFMIGGVLLAFGCLFLLLPRRRLR